MVKERNSVILCEKLFALCGKKNTHFAVKDKTLSEYTHRETRERHRVHGVSFAVMSTSDSL
jgi:hypothetical protein